MNILNVLLADASNADGLGRIEYRDRIAEFGLAAIERLAPWLEDPRLCRFALLTIEKAAAQPGARVVAIAVLERTRSGCPDAERGELVATLRRLRRAAGAKSVSVRSANQSSASPLLPVPDALRVLVERWRAAGSAKQPGILWPRDLWIADLPRFSDLLRGLPTLLDRDAVRSACSESASSANEAELALVAVMVWGQGNRGYARFRTGHILSNDNAAGRLHQTLRTLDADGVVAAYRRMSRKVDCGLDGLGPSFGTKYLYFCQSPGLRPMALVLDTLVAEWLRDKGALNFRSEQWSDKTYEAYLRQMHAWAEELMCAPDELEQCIFQDRADESGGQWGKAGGGVPRRPKPSSGAPGASVWPDSPTSVELRFHQAMLDIYELAGRETGYWAGYFLRSVRNDGGIATARKLLWKAGTSAGFERLKAERRLDISMEAVMLRPEFRELFTTQELVRAAERLTEHGYPTHDRPE
jgi:hypothetical protein